MVLPFNNALFALSSILQSSHFALPSERIVPPYYTHSSFASLLTFCLLSFAYLFNCYAEVSSSPVCSPAYIIRIIRIKVTINTTCRLVYTYSPITLVFTISTFRKTTTPNSIPTLRSIISAWKRDSSPITYCSCCYAHINTFRNLP